MRIGVLAVWLMGCGAGGVSLSEGACQDDDHVPSIGPEDDCEVRSPQWVGGFTAGGTTSGLYEIYAEGAFEGAWTVEPSVAVDGGEATAGVVPPSLTLADAPASFQVIVQLSEDACGSVTGTVTAVSDANSDRTALNTFAGDVVDEEGESVGCE